MSDDKLAVKLVSAILRILRVVRRTFFTLLLIASLLFNGALLLSDAVFKVASGAVSAITGVKSLVVRQADELSEMSSHLVAERAATREVRSELTETTVELAAEKKITREVRSELAENAAELAAEKKITREIRSELAENAAELAAQRAITRQLRGELTETSAGLALALKSRRDAARAARTIRSRVATRSAKSAVRTAASAPGKAIPTAGAVLVATLTAIEIADLCATVSDMNELASVLSPEDSSLDEGDPLTVCGVEPPTRSEILEAIQNSPDAAWKTAIETIPSLEELKEMELPDVDWNELGASIAKTSTDWMDAGAAWGGSKWGQVKTWWDN